MQETIKNWPLSVIICTYKRTNILAKTLASFSQLDQVDTVECILVNNNRDEIAEKVTAIVANYPEIRLINEPQTGLSYARNTGLKHARGKWLVFLDDDVQLPANFLTIAYKHIQSDQFDCFGGRYYPWYVVPKPAWLPVEFGQKVALSKATSQITPGKEGFLSAGIFAIKTSALVEMDGFRTDLGMNNQIGYGEEDALQLKLHQSGYRIGFTPDWQMKHAVMPHKYSVWWHLRSTFARARDAHYISGNTAAGKTLLKFLASIIAAVFKRTPQVIVKLISKRDYYWQNAFLEIMSPIWAYAGRYSGIRRCQDGNKE